MLTVLALFGCAFVAFKRLQKNREYDEYEDGIEATEIRDEEEQEDFAREPDIAEEATTART
jgi:hypothetical protein